MPVELPIEETELPSVFAVDFELLTCFKQPAVRVLTELGKQLRQCMDVTEIGKDPLPIVIRTVVKWDSFGKTYHQLPPDRWVSGDAFQEILKELGLNAAWVEEVPLCGRPPEAIYAANDKRRKGEHITSSHVNLHYLSTAKGESKGWTVTDTLMSAGEFEAEPMREFHALIKSKKGCGALVDLDGVLFDEYKTIERMMAYHQQGKLLDLPVLHKTLVAKLRLLRTFDPEFKIILMTARRDQGTATYEERRHALGEEATLNDYYSKLLNSTEAIRVALANELGCEVADIKVVTTRASTKADDPKVLDESGKPTKEHYSKAHALHDKLNGYCPAYWAVDDSHLEVDAYLDAKASGVPLYVSHVLPNAGHLFDGATLGKALTQAMGSREALLALEEKLNAPELSGDESSVTDSVGGSPRHLSEPTTPERRHRRTMSPSSVVGLFGSLLRRRPPATPTKAPAKTSPALFEKRRRAFGPPRVSAASAPYQFPRR